MGQWARDHIPFPGAAFAQTVEGLIRRTGWSTAPSSSAANASTSARSGGPSSTSWPSATTSSRSPPPSRCSASSARREGGAAPRRRPRRSRRGPQGREGHAAGHRRLVQGSTRAGDLMDIRAPPGGPRRAHAASSSASPSPSARSSRSPCSTAPRSRLADRRARPARARARRRRPRRRLRRHRAPVRLVGPRRRGALVVDPEQRGKGVGRALARWALLQALEAGLHEADRRGRRRAGGCGRRCSAAWASRPRALLRDHVRDRDGTLRDLILLSHSVEDAWSAMETAGIDDALA